MRCIIKCVKVDCLPLQREKDLCLGSIAKYFKLDGRKRCIYFKHVTIKYTSSLVLQAFITGSFKKILRALPLIFDTLRRKFNLYKRTPVTAFKSIIINNIHSVGHFTSLDFSWINTSYLPASFSFCASSHVQDNLLIPFKGKLPDCAQVVSLNKDPSGTIKINLVTGYFTFISKSVDDFILMKNVFDDLTSGKIN